MAAGHRFHQARIRTWSAGASQKPLWVSGRLPPGSHGKTGTPRPAYARAALSSVVFLVLLPAKPRPVYTAPWWRAPTTWGRHAGVGFLPVARLLAGIALAAAEVGTNPHRRPRSWTAAIMTLEEHA